MEKLRESPPLRGLAKGTLFGDSRRSCLAWYSVLFSLGCLLCFWPFISNGKSFVWNPDAINLHYPALMVYGRYLRQLLAGLFQGNLAFSQFDFSIGYGLDRLAYVLPNYTEPVNLLSVFVPEQYTEYLYNALVIIRLYLVGLAFLAYCFFTKRDTYASCLGALLYTFCNYTIFAGPRAPYFLGAMICLPLLLIGIEEILCKQTISLKLCAAVCLSALSSFYFLWMNTLFCVIYFLLRFSEKEEKSCRAFFKGVFTALLSALLGLACSAVFLLPNVLLYLGSDRTKTALLSPNIWPFYSPIYLKRVLAYIATPWLSPGNWSHISVLGIGVLGVFALLSRIRGYKGLKLGYLLAMCALMIPACALFMDAFTTVRNRWAYQIVLVVAIIVTVTWGKIASFTKRDFLILFLCVFVYIAYISAVATTQNIYSFIGIILLLLTLSVIYIAAEIGFTSVRSRALVVLLVLINIGIMGYVSYSPRYANYIDQFYNSGYPYNSAKKESPYGALLAVEDHGFYRADADSLSRKYIGSPMVLGVNGTSIFNNVMDKNMFRYMDAVSNGDVPYSSWLYGLDNRAFLMTSNNVKYWISKKGASAPYGFEPFYSSNGRVVYRNNYFLPLGYTYTEAVPEAELLKLSPVEKQEVLMQAVALEGIGHTAKTVNAGQHKLKYRVVKSDGLTQKKGAYVVQKKNATLTLQFDQRKNAEHYILFHGFNIDQKTDIAWNLKITSQQSGKTFSSPIGTPYTFWKFIRDPMVNLGYTKEGGEATYTITFPSKGTFTLESLEVYAQSMENYASYVEKLSENTLENLEIDLNQVRGTLSLDRDKYLYFSIPYSRGWTATVDGEKTDILRANIAFMAIPVGPGKHDIVLTYHTPGLAAGAALSALSLAIVLALKIRRKKQSKPNAEENLIDHAC